VASGFTIDIKVNPAEVTRIVKGLSKVRLAAALLGGKMMPALGELITKQHKHRINSEKRSPDGARWPANIRGNSVMVLTGALAGSIHHQSGPLSTRISPGNFPYTRIHQTGGTIYPRRGRALVFSVGGNKIFARKSRIPQRMYMGLSAANLAEIKIVVDKFVGGAFGWLR
jgi:phage gpG-like protein